MFAGAGLSRAGAGAAASSDSEAARRREIDALLVLALRKKERAGPGVGVDTGAALARAESIYAAAIAYRAAAAGGARTAAPLHQCTARACTLVSFRRGEPFADPREPAGAARHRASGNFYVCASSGHVHHCTEDECDASDETPQGSVCRISRLVRQLISHYTLGARRGHTETGDMGVPAPRPVALPAPTPVSERQTRLVAALAPARTGSPNVLAASLGAAEADFDARRRRTKRAATSVARLEHIYFGNRASKEEEARRIVEALLCSPLHAELRRARYDAALARADAAIVAYLRDRAARAVAPCLVDIVALFAHDVPRVTLNGAYVHDVPATPRTALDYYVRVCMATWRRVCRSEVASDAREKRHPSFRKHCIGVLYRMRNGYYVTVELTAADFGANTTAAALLARPIVRHLTLLVHDAHLARALPDHADVDTIIETSGISGDKKYAREGCNMLRDCYYSLLETLRQALRQALAVAKDRAAVAAAITEFLTGVQSLDFASVVGEPLSAADFERAEQALVPMSALAALPKMRVLAPALSGPAPRHNEQRADSDAIVYKNADEIVDEIDDIMETINTQR